MAASRPLDISRWVPRPTCAALVVQGIFAQGQLYVLVSRVTDPKHFVLIGVPPRDLLEDVARAVFAEGLDVDYFYRRACSVTNEWVYDPARQHFADRFKQRRFIEKEKSVPLRFRTLEQCLDPQPDALAVIKRLLDWIDRCDWASLYEDAPQPPFCTSDGEPIFPQEGIKWWLTELSQRKAEEEAATVPPGGDEDGPPSECAEDEEGDSDVIHPELPAEDDDFFSDECDELPPFGGTPVRVLGPSHDAKLICPVPKGR